MAGTVLRESPMTDFYCVWSSVVDAPTFVGNRAEVLTYLARESDPWLSADAPHRPENRLARADETGTSSLWVQKAAEESAEFAAHGYPEWGSWADNSYIYQQEGTLTREGLFTLCHRLVEQGENVEVSDLLTPFEDEED